MVDIIAIPDKIPDELLDLKNDSAARDLFEEKSPSPFRRVMLQSHSNLAAAALRVLLPFASTNLCKAGFSNPVYIKSKSGKN